MRVRAFGAAACLLLLVVSAHVLVQSGSLAGGPAASDAMLPAPRMRGIDVAIIVHPDNPTRDISLFALRQYFQTRKTKWPNGETVFVAMLPHQPERDRVLSVIFNTNEIGYGSRYFSELTTKKITELNRPDIMMGYVRNNRGAIGYVRDDLVNEGMVRKLKVNGLWPGQAGYPINIR